MLEGRDDPVPKQNMRKVDPDTGIDLGLCYDPVGQDIDMSPGSLVGFGDQHDISIYSIGAIVRPEPHARVSTISVRIHEWDCQGRDNARFYPLYKDREGIVKYMEPWTTAPTGLTPCITVVNKKLVYCNIKFTGNGRLTQQSQQRLRGDPVSPNG